MKIENNFSLKAYNTFNIDAMAKYFARISSLSDVQELCDSNLMNDSHKFVIGSGSNLLFANDFDGLIIKSNICGIDVVELKGDYAIIRAGSAVLWDDFVKYCVNNKFYGLENLALIPGTVGAAPVQNIGAYGVEQQDFFYKVEGYYLSSGERFCFDATDCMFEYRNSIFKNALKNNIIITHVQYKLLTKPIYNLEYKELKELLNQADKLSSELVYETVAKIRFAKLPDPLEIGNAGSFYKNPIVSSEKFKELKVKFPDCPSFEIRENDRISYKIPAAFLIEKCGWKGKNVGNCGVFDKHSLILVNYGNAKGSDIIKLADAIESSVEEQFTIKLEREVIVV